MFVVRASKLQSLIDMILPGSELAQAMQFWIMMRAHLSLGNPNRPEEMAGMLILLTSPNFLAASKVLSTADYSKRSLS